MFRELFIILGFSLFGPGNGFVLPTSSTSCKQSLVVRSMDASALQEIEAARSAFVLCFAGAVGSAAVGREAIPVTYREWQKRNELKGKGTSLGGQDLELFGYPEPVYSKDVMSVLKNNMTVNEMMEAYPVEGALPGYLRYESLAKANEGTSQMAVRAVFDSIAMGINKNQVNPFLAEQKMELFKEDIGLLKENSQLTKTVGVTALVLLLSILGAADFFAVYHLWHGWFPEWHGFDQMPYSLFDERGISNLASTFIMDLPAADSSGAFPM